MMNRDDLRAVIGLGIFYTLLAGMFGYLWLTFEP